MTDEDREILALERRWYARPGAKETAILAELGMSPVRYYQRLLSIVEDPEALAAEPVLVHRLRRLKERRAF